MTSLDVRSNSAVMKRAEQLKRWEESDTNRAPATPRPENGRKIKFSSGCVFLAACLCSDKEEVVKLLENGADINTANVDGLTALHQACIDDNLDMVEFLVEHDADINRQDNEGWTPLHATASCGFVSIARYLIEHGADVAAVNSDGDLALDLALDIQHLPMIEYMQQMVNEHKIDCEKARKAEEQMMLADAKKSLRSDAAEVDRPHPKTGATALHVAAAKGYTKVISLLLAGHANVDKQDNDGWTPLHAAAHWGQKDAAEMLVDALADMEIRNYAGMTCIDVADRKMVKFFEELRAKSKRIKRRPSSQIRISDTSEQHLDTSATKIMRIEPSKEQMNSDDDVKKKNATITNNNTTTISSDSVATETPTITTATASPTSEPEVITATISIPFPKTTPITANSTENDDAPWRRNNLLQRSRLQVPEKDTDVMLRRTQSFEHDKKKPFSSPRATNSLALNSANSVTAITVTSTKIANTVASAATTTTSSGITTTNSSNTPVRRSFAPPQRNEESETQRKAHAKRVRETRRSTQGVTLDEIKSAEELVKKNNSTMSNTNSNNNNTNNNKVSKSEDESNNTNSTFPPSNHSKIIPSAPAVIAAANLCTSVAQRLSAGNNSLTEATIRLNNNTALTSGTTTAAISTTIISNQSNANNIIDKDTEDKENDSRSLLTTQAVIQRRRKPKRRSTGVVHIDMEELDLEPQDSVTDTEEKDKNEGPTSNAKSKQCTDCLDYKTLWEEIKLDRDNLKEEMAKKNDELAQAKTAVERLTNAATAKNSFSELEKRERRAMERKLSEMEEELKQLELYKAENQRLKEENGALIRVISKLSK